MSTLSRPPILHFKAVWLPPSKAHWGYKTHRPPVVQAPPDSKNDIIVLSPFVVASQQDKGYAATTTLAGTRLRTDLNDVGAAISVVTEQFLSDTGATNSKSLLTFTTGTEVVRLGHQQDDLGLVAAQGGVVIHTSRLRIIEHVNCAKLQGFGNKSSVS